MHHPTDNADNTMPNVLTQNDDGGHSIEKSAHAFNWCVFPLRVLRFRFDLAAAAAVFVSILRAIVYYPNRRTTEKGREILLIL